MAAGGREWGGKGDGILPRVVVLLVAHSSVVDSQPMIATANAEIAIAIAINLSIGSVVMVEVMVEGCSLWWY